MAPRDGTRRVVARKRSDGNSGRRTAFTARWTCSHSPLTKPKGPDGASGGALRKCTATLRFEGAIQPAPAARGA
eukprot:6398634-Prymnesium_polylepis.2